MSAFAHIVVLIFYKQYIKDLRLGINRFRWIEYAFSSSLMICLIAMLFGMYSVITLILLGECCCCCQGAWVRLCSLKTIHFYWLALLEPLPPTLLLVVWLPQ